MMKAGLALALGLALSTSANAQRNNASSAPPPPPAAIPPPPPPPPLPDSPAVAAAMAKAQACFFRANWDRSVQLRFQAEDAEDKLTGDPGSANWNAARDLVDAYVRSREPLVHCIVEYRKAWPKFDDTPNTKAAYQILLGSMIENYDAQGTYETALLIGLFDKEEAERVRLTQYR